LIITIRKRSSEYLRESIYAQERCGFLIPHPLKEGKAVPGGAASILRPELDPAKNLSSLRIEVDLYGPVINLLGATLVRSH
jgi:hypothetical protein